MSNQNNQTPTFRFAERQDIPLILEFIRELVKCEKMEDQMTATEQQLEQRLFDQKAAEVLFVLKGEKEVGFALFYHNFSTFLGRKGLYMEVLFIKSGFRRKGYGTALMKQLARIARQRGCKRMEWLCPNWNSVSIFFYMSLGADAMGDWAHYRLKGSALRKLAK